MRELVNANVNTFFQVDIIIFQVPSMALTNICSTDRMKLQGTQGVCRQNKKGKVTIISKYIEATTLPTPEEADMAQRACCGRVCNMCESPAEYAWRRRTVDLALLLEDAVAHDLSEPERAAVEKYWFDGMTLTQVAAETGRAPPNVARTLERAKQKLHAALRLTVMYQYNLENADLVPLAVRKAAAVAAAQRHKARSTGETLRNLRLRENISAAQLAKTLEIPFGRLRAAETEKIQLNANELLLLAAFFNTTADFILGGDEGA